MKASSGSSSSRNRPSQPHRDKQKAEVALSTEDVQWLRRRTRSWYRAHGREFAWRASDEPYDVLIAELLLQRTRADLVPRDFAAVQTRYADPGTLARADRSEVNELLRSLGLIHRD